MKAKKRFVCYLLFGLWLCVFIWAENVSLESQWIVSAIKIDADSSDWMQSLSPAWKKGKVDCSFANDDKNLYFLLVFNDLKYLSSISQTGLKVWLQGGEKNAKDTGFFFIPKIISAEGMINRFEKDGVSLSEEKKQEIRQKEKFVLYEGEYFHGKKPGVLPPLGQDVKPAVFRTAKSGTSFIYEIRLPLNIEFLREEKGIQPGTAMRIGFEWGGMTEEMKADMMRRRSISSTRAEERASSVVTRGDDSDSTPVVGNKDMPFQKGAPRYSFWLEVHLASKPESGR
ncbi:MAG: hypothetical protein JXB26_19580 [Candidatus Aminicenantes bacterium]|nr:hypothetical protein [Candidatus Aminicenantes bacterium]